MNVPKPNIVWRGAHPENFTIGRPGGGLDGRNTFHHVVGSAESAVLVFNSNTRGVSSHLVITDRADVAAWQCVDFANTAWCDSNWQSNLRTISMEHHGDWRFGYNNAQVLENSAKVVAWLRDQNLVSRPVRHREVSTVATLCPADLPVEAIWNRATQIIASYNTPVDTRPQWLKDRTTANIPVTVYAQRANVFLRNLNSPNEPADARRFVLNQNFAIGSKTVIAGKTYFITVSSTTTNAATGLSQDDVSATPYVAPAPVPAPTPTPVPTPVPPAPKTPDWADSLLIDHDNTTMYVLRATPLIDLEYGRPYRDSANKEVWYQAGDIVKDISAKTIVSEVTYELTEYSFQNVKAGKLAVANGIKAEDLTLNPKATPPGTPANPTPAPAPADPIEPMPDVPPTDSTKVDKSVVILFLEGIVTAITAFLTNLKKG